MIIISSESTRSVVGISNTIENNIDQQNMVVGDEISFDEKLIGETICAIPTINGNRIDQQNMVVGDEISFDEKLIGEETILSTTTIENNGRETL